MAHSWVAPRVSICGGELVKACMYRDNKQHQCSIGFILSIFNNVDTCVPSTVPSTVRVVIRKTQD